MIRHIVLFKLKAFETAQQKEEKMQEIKTKLESLAPLIPELKVIEAGINRNENEQFDISLLTEFDSMDDLHAYAIHPNHVAVGKIIREVLEARACVDSVI
ncbi:MAG: Dabb family protein [Prevotellaceae bacterium]|jgi:hypothetical protein|nr:Dabb family protein [Prevotellaceae bacterium]